MNTKPGEREGEQCMECDDGGGELQAAVFLNIWQKAEGRKEEYEREAGSIQEMRANEMSE